jgi:hypothetical protein
VDGVRAPRGTVLEIKGAFSDQNGQEHVAEDKKNQSLRICGERPRPKGRIFLLYLKAHNNDREFRSTFLSKKLNNHWLWREA